MNLMQPWILLRLLAGLTATLLVVRSSMISLRILRHFDARWATEGQLALERQAELAATLVRVAAWIQVGALVLSVLAADRLHHSVRGAMCAYGVLSDNRWGFPALGLTAGVAFIAGLIVQLCAFDRRVRSLDLVRPIAVISILMAPLSIADLGFTAGFLARLDLTVVSSCCSSQLDVGALGGREFPSGPRLVVSAIALVTVSLSIVVGWAASLRPRASTAMLAAAVSLIALPAMLCAAVLEVAPYAFELPQHACPFCLLRPEVLGIGYPLFGSIFLAAVWTVGAGVSGLARTGQASMADAFDHFARTRLRRGALAWLVSLVFGLGPVLRYAILSGGRPLFP